MRSSRRHPTTPAPRARFADRHRPEAVGETLPRAGEPFEEAIEAGARAGDSPSREDRPIPPLTRLRIEFVRGFLVGWMGCFGLAGLYALGRFFGTIEFLTDYRRRRRVFGKLASLFGREHSRGWRNRAAHRYFMRIRCDKMFYTIMDRIPRAQLMNRIKFSGAEHLDAALARGNGAYVALCHFGSHLIAGFMMALLQYDIAGVRDPKESHVRRYMQRKYRETFPELARMTVLYASSFPRMIYRHLKRNGVVASLLDADRNRGETTRTMPVRLFGESREVLTGPVQMALRCGSPVLQGFVISGKNFYYKLIVTPPLLVPGEEGDEATGLSRVLQQYADGVEDFARHYPDHLMNI